jgi:hypothetical protein
MPAPAGYISAKYESDSFSSGTAAQAGNSSIPMTPAACLRPQQQLSNSTSSSFHLWFEVVHEDGRESTGSPPPLLFDLPNHPVNMNFVNATVLPRNHDLWKPCLAWHLQSVAVGQQHQVQRLAAGHLSMASMSSSNRSSRSCGSIPLELAMICQDACAEGKDSTIHAESLLVVCCVMHDKLLLLLLALYCCCCCRIGGVKVLMAGVLLWSFGTLIAPPAAHMGIWALCATRVLVSNSGSSSSSCIEEGSASQSQLPSSS